ncbi:hypothetical protein K9F62_10335 [Desulfovibrio sp. JY]|nr:hypothetical protein K9F62_10335 [Desulfovibrio sp. JY]
MAALTKDRNTPRRKGKIVVHPVAAGAVFFVGALAVLNATGYAEPATTATGKKGLGRATGAVSNATGADGAAFVEVERGVFAFDNDGTDTVTRAHVGGSAYAVDDQTVASNDGTGTRSAIGIIRDVDAINGVWVEF